MLLRDFVNKKMASADKEASAEGYPLQLDDCKKYKKMRQLEVYGNSYQDGTPSPDNPIEVQHIGDKTVNLFNPNAPKEQGYLMDDGSVLYESAYPQMYCYTFDVKPDTTYIINSIYTNIIVYVLYNSNMEYITRYYLDSNVTSSKEVVFTTTSDTAYIKICTNKNRAENGEVYFNEGNVLIKEPYGKYKIPVTQRGVNMFPENLIRKTNSSRGITVDYEGNGIFYIHGRFDNTDGSTISFNHTMFDGLNLPIDLKAYYTLHAKVISGSCSHRVLPYLGTRDATTAAGSKINWIDVPVQPGTYEEGSIFSKTRLGGYGASANATGIKQFWFWWSNDGKDITVDMRIQVWLTKSSTILPYEPYVEPVTTNIFLDEPLRNITNAYNGHIAEEYMDYIDFKNKKVHRRLHEYCFDGSISPQQTTDTICNIDIGIVAKSTTWQSWQGLSNRFSPTGYLTPYDEPFLCVANSIGSKISFRNFHMIPGVTDATTLKQWLTENPVTWVFPFATPKEEPLDIELPKLNTRTTIFEVGTNLAPSSLKGKYIKR